MGGSGGGGGTFSSRANPEQLRAAARDEIERARLAIEVNGLLARVLANVNERDVATVADRLDEIREGLMDQGVEIDTLLFGGSVAKHTYVDGLSDIDSLVLLDVESLSDATPSEARQQLRQALLATLDMGDVKSIDSGSLAVTIHYRDGSVVQLLPAVRRGDAFMISSEDGEAWRNIRPKSFAMQLTRANERLGSALVPAIKLAKSIIAGLPEDQRLSGYHVEALALDAFADYDGPRNPMAMVGRFFASATKSVLRPIKDVTGQSKEVDESLGEPYSVQRQKVAASLARIARTIDTAPDIGSWRELLGLDA